MWGVGVRRMRERVGFEFLQEFADGWCTWKGDELDREIDEYIYGVLREKMIEENTYLAILRHSLPIINQLRLQNVRNRQLHIRSLISIVLAHTQPSSAKSKNIRKKPS